MSTKIASFFAGAFTSMAALWIVGSVTLSKGWNMEWYMTLILGGATGVCAKWFFNEAGIRWGMRTGVLILGTFSKTLFGGLATAVAVVIMLLLPSRK